MKRLYLIITLSVLLIAAGCSAGKKPVVVNFEGKQFEKKWALKELNKELPRDWSQYEYLYHL